MDKYLMGDKLHVTKTFINLPFKDCGSAGHFYVTECMRKIKVPYRTEVKF
jgi:hypothetical protein